MAATSMKRAGKVSELLAREIVTSPFFEGLPQHFQAAAVELRQFVQEEHAVVGQADLPGPGDAAAADEPGVRDGVVRRPERRRGSRAWPGGRRPMML